MAKFGFAVIGCGRMGERRASAIAQNPSGELICTVDNNKKGAKSLARKFSCDFYTDFRRAIEREDVKVVVVALPNKFHAEVSIESANFGKHILCEKPLARNPEEAKLMVEAALENRVFLKAGSNVRFFSNILGAKRLIDGGVIGKPLFMRGWIGHSGWNLQPESWFTNPEIIGGGTLLDNGCHLIDLVRWFMGEIKECFGHCSTLLHPLNGLEDNALGVLTTMDGRPAFIQSSWTEWMGYLYVEVYGDKGMVCIDNRGEVDKLILKPKSTDAPQTFDYSNKPKISFKLEVDDLIDSLLTNKQPLPSGYDGMRIVQVIHGLYESAKKGCKVSVYGDEERELERLMLSGYGQSFR